MEVSDWRNVTQSDVPTTNWPTLGWSIYTLHHLKLVQLRKWRCQVSIMCHNLMSQSQIGPHWDGPFTHWTIWELGHLGKWRCQIGVKCHNLMSQSPIGPHWDGPSAHWTIWELARPGGCCVVQIVVICNTLRVQPVSNANQVVVVWRK